MLCRGATLALWLSIAACSPPSRDLQLGRYRATLQTQGGELPFVLEAVRKSQHVELFASSGGDRLALRGIQVGAGKLLAQWPDAGGRLTATIEGRELRGAVALTGANGRPVALPFVATVGATWGFFEQPLTDNADAAGRWSVTFTGDGGATTRGIADLSQKFEQVSGTFRTREFEHRVAGEVHGDELRLAHFDGRTGQLYVARVNARGELEGTAWTLAASRLRFVAVRNPDAVLEDPPVAGRGAQPTTATQ